MNAVIAMKRVIAIATLCLCAAGEVALADTPVTSLADGRVGRISFSVPASTTSLRSLVEGNYVLNETIWGELLLPQGATGAVPAMVISHGSGGLGALSYEWAELFARMGVATFVIDHFDGRGFASTFADQSRLNYVVIPADGLLALQLLATHPRIDAGRIGYIGFSKGGGGALLSAYERMRAAVLPGVGTRFALHLPFYPGGWYTANQLTGAPIRVFMGDLDDYDTVPHTRAMIEYLRAMGGDVEFTVYPGAYHAFDATFAPTWVADAQTSKNCPLATNVDTLITIDTTTGARITDATAYNNACRTVGTRVGNSEPARSQSRQAVWSFVRQQFGLASIPDTVPAPAEGTTNYTALWWDREESGWGVNFNHQGNILFGTLFTYDADRAPLWLVMSAGRLLGSSSTFAGDLYRTTGPAFNANPFTPVPFPTKVGTMTVTFSGANSATLTYSVNGVTVSKAIERQVYGTRAANCAPTTASRATATNYQDLWWNPAESGWGINVTHQDSTIFATLFTYDASGRDLWLVMSAGQRQADGSFAGDLFRTAGPAFNARPFTGVTVVPVGVMRLGFTNGENGTLTYTYNGATVTKAITRQLFSSPVPACN